MDRFVSRLQLGMNACVFTFVFLIAQTFVGLLPQSIVDIGIAIVSIPTAWVLADWLSNTSQNHR